MQEQFENLKVWQKSMEFVKQIYTATQAFPRSEEFGLVSQMRRAAVSIPVNIAEGKGRYHKKEYVQFLYVSRGSLYELMTLIQLAKEMFYISEEENKGFKLACGEIAAMLNGLIRAVS